MDVVSIYELKLLCFSYGRTYISNLVYIAFVIIELLAFVRTERIPLVFTAHTSKLEKSSSISVLSQHMQYTLLHADAKGIQKESRN